MVTLYGFGIFSIWIGDNISGYDSVSTLNNYCWGRRCGLEGTYGLLHKNFLLFVCMIVYGVIGLVYIKRKKFKRINLRKTR